MRVLAYLDDILVLAVTAEEHAATVARVVADLAAAGLRISGAKAFLAPYVVMDFLGLTIDLQQQAFVSLVRK